MPAAWAAKLIVTHLHHQGHGCCATFKESSAVAGRRHCPPHHPHRSHYLPPQTWPLSYFTTSPSTLLLTALVATAAIFIASDRTAYAAKLMKPPLSRSPLLPGALGIDSEAPEMLTDLDFANAERLSKDEIYRSGSGKAKGMFQRQYRQPGDDIRSEGVPIWVLEGKHRPNAPSDNDLGHLVQDSDDPLSWGNMRRRVKRNGVSKPAKLWPNARIPYAISTHYTTHERALLARAVKQYHDKTCLRFTPRTAHEGDYLFIGKVDGCFSEVGRTSGVQVLSLDNGCMEYSTIIHEIMHVVGFYHEHERWDRDQYIDIICRTIKTDSGALDQFGKVDLSKTSYYGQPYDYKSILHYDSQAFSKNGFPTMLPKRQGLASTIGNARDFSEIDLAKINRMYRCEQWSDQPPAATSSQPASIVKLARPDYFRPLPFQRGVKAVVQSALPAASITTNAYNDHHSHQSSPFAPNQALPSYSSYGNYAGRSLVLPTSAEKLEGGGAGSQRVINYRDDRELVDNGDPIAAAAIPTRVSLDKDACEDRITICWWTQERCHAPSIYTMMRTLCAKTCRFC